ncbi:MAG TPA: tRNA glutamyl-Q(34) synthetase GluQRS [Methylocella sp.]|jgi:glutamyl-Q tRNA(Asp) synthetase|nr:tRNA glutamyl-Q(34) synthetase GluQRS [Methylocella sp.]
MTRSFTNRVFRFAPSPNGYLHLGHAYSALLNFDTARAAGGRFLLRIEDIDIERCRFEFEQAIYEDLDWLGLAWETPVRRQSEHFSDYASALAKLSAQGLTYPCFCSRGEIMNTVAGRTGWPRDPDGSPLYPGICKHLSREERQRRIAAGRPAALRINMEAAVAKAGRGLAWREMGPSSQTREVAAEPSHWGDTTLARKDIPASYHIAVVVDDALQGVTDVVRGEDLFPATSLHRLLQDLVELPAPTYRHHALLRDALGQKLSKSSKAKSLRALRQDGLSPAAVQERLTSDPILAGGP